MKRQKYATPTIIILCFILFLGINILSASPVEEKEKQEQENRPPIVEEIEVVGQVPADLPLSTVSVIPKEKIDKITPKNLGEVLNFTPGAYVTEGQKGESGLMIRGLSSQRLTLLYDGIPIYEPYFNSFDLKSFSSGGLDSVKVIKGATSVLYGPNAMAGVINVVSMRPEQPFLSLDAQVGEEASYFLSGTGGYKWDKLSFVTSATLDKSDGFNWNREGQRTKRDGSDYQRGNFSGKFYYTPSGNAEFMAQVLYYNAEYSIPAATEFSKPRYWKFTDWKRWQVNLGGTFGLGDRGSVKVRGYYVDHFNVLDDLSSWSATVPNWESTYKNHTFGVYALAEYDLFAGNDVKMSLTYSNHDVNQQSDIGDPWEEYRREIYSLGLEDHISIGDKWKLIGGASIDYLVKQTDEKVTRVNPIIGIKYFPHDWLDFHISLSQKSRFPSLRSLYSTSSGNPELQDETARTAEWGIHYQRGISLEGALFFTRIDDMIQAYRGLEGYKNYQNVGQAEIYGFELGLGKTIGKLHFDLNYTYLQARDRADNEPLDFTPTSQLNAFIQLGDFSGFSLSLWAMAATDSIARLGKQPPFTLLDIPGYAILNARIEKRLGDVTLYIKGENLLAAGYFSEPGFPMKGRAVSFGVQAFLSKD